MSKSLHQMTREELGKLFPIELSRYNPAWKDSFEEEKTNILSSIDSTMIICIDHIGSTAIPHLISKPTIDILLQIAEKVDIQEIIRKIKALGYEFIPQPDNPPPHMMFVRGYTAKYR